MGGIELDQKSGSLEYDAPPLESVLGFKPSRATVAAAIELEVELDAKGIWNSATTWGSEELEEE